MRKILLFVPILLVISSFSSCDKNNVSNHPLEGTWKLTSTSGGFSGGGFDADFDYIIIDEDLNVTIEASQNKIAEGYVNELELDTTIHASAAFYVEFIEEENLINQSISIFSDHNKYVVFDGDNMSLNSPCCDRYDFHFEKD